MTEPTHATPSAGRHRAPALLPAIAVAALLAAVAGHLAASGGGAAAPAPGARRPGPAAPRAPATAAAPAPMAELPAPPAAIPAAPAFAAPPAPDPRLAAAVAAEAAARLEAQRAGIVERCWPPSGLRSGRSSARVRINLTFDREGREIARGIMEDRRAPAGEFAACLRRLADLRLSVPPPGATVAVTLPIAFP